MNRTQNIDAIFKSQIKNTLPTTLRDRIDYLSRIEQWIELNRDSIIEAHFSDLHKPESETELAEIWYVLSEIKLAKNLAVS